MGSAIIIYQISGHEYPFFLFFHSYRSYASYCYTLSSITQIVKETPTSPDVILARLVTTALSTASPLPLDNAMLDSSVQRDRASPDQLTFRAALDTSALLEAITRPVVHRERTSLTGNRVTAMSVLRDFSARLSVTLEIFFNFFTSF